MTLPSTTVVTIAGLDPGCGAGLVADVEAIREAGGQPRALCAALTAQGEGGVNGVQQVSVDFVSAQLRSLGRLDGAKTGMLWSADLIARLASLIDGGELPPPVVDPVINASAGGTLLEPAAMSPLRRRLLPRARAVTPNLAEAALLTRRPVATVREMEDAARRLLGEGPALVVITGGHLHGELIDVGMAAGDPHPWRIRRERIPGTARGTGCRFSAALATYLASGRPDREAVEAAGDLVARHIAG